MYGSWDALDRSWVLRRSKKADYAPQDILMMNELAKRFWACSHVVQTASRGVVNAG